MKCVFFSGGIAGVVSWIPSYPFDVIKTKIQTNKDPKVNTRFIPFTRNLIKTEGVAVLYRGILTTLVRAFPVNSVTFGFASSVIYLIVGSLKVNF